MYWFKNLMIYQLTKELDWSSDYLQTQLVSGKFSPCSQSDRLKFGWSEPLRGNEMLHFSVGKHILLVAHKEEKILPSPVVKSELESRIQQIEQQANRKLKKVEKQALQEDIIASLLPRAFSKNQKTALWIDTETNLIYVDAASSKRAEDTLALLRKCLGSLPVIPLNFNLEPAIAMTNWIAQDNLPEWLVALEEAEFTGSEDQGIIRCKQQALDSEEMLYHLQAGKLVTKLALDWDEHLSFILQQDGCLKRLKFADQIREKNEDILKEDYAQRFDADFVLMTGVLAKLTANLVKDLGGIKASLT